MKHIAIIGAGPAGLRAAEVAAEHGAQVSVFDAKPSAGRKFLIAGKSGLNLTNNEDWQTFLSRYQGNDLPTETWNKILNNFDNNALRHWAAGLGIETFAASSGKVFPTSMKAAPLLRRWIQKLRQLGVHFHFNHRLTQLDKDLTLQFEYRKEPHTYKFDAVILALGGASHPATGSTGKWTKIFDSLGIRYTPLSAANCGWETNWHKELLDDAEGLPLKNIIVHAGDKSQHGELVITKYGLEGGPIYRLGPAIKSLPTPEIRIDFKPTFSHAQLIAKMESAKRNLLHEAKLRWKLHPSGIAILKHLKQWQTVEELAQIVKSCTIPLTQPRPIKEAISSAGGVSWDELDADLMVRKVPNLYCAGEMIDWEAPTGGYLLQACFATGTHAGKAVSKGR